MAMVYGVDLIPGHACQQQLLAVTCQVLAGSEELSRMERTNAHLPRLARAFSLLERDSWNVDQGDLSNLQGVRGNTALRTSLLCLIASFGCLVILALLVCLGATVLHASCPAGPAAMALPCSDASQLYSRHHVITILHLQGLC